MLILTPSHILLRQAFEWTNKQTLWLLIVFQMRTGMMTNCLVFEPCNENLVSGCNLINGKCECDTIRTCNNPFEFPRKDMCLLALKRIEGEYLLSVVSLEGHVTLSSDRIWAGKGKDELTEVGGSFDLKQDSKVGQGRMWWCMRACVCAHLCVS